MPPFYYKKPTPYCLKCFIGILVALALLSPPLTFFFHHTLLLPGPSDWFALSRWGIQQGWLWQPFTYFLIHSLGSSLSLSLCLSLFFQMLLIWFAGSDLIARFGARSFFFFYLGGTSLIGLITAVALFFLPSLSLLYGSSAPTFALLVVWTMLDPDLELFFFFILRIKAKWLIAILLGLSLLSYLAAGEWLPLLANVSGVLWGLAIGQWVWKLPNPYPLNLEWPKKQKSTHSGKIIDISVIQEDDAHFMDRMLEKISTKGKDALTRKEQLRMDEIAKRKK